MEGAGAATWFVYEYTARPHAYMWHIIAAREYIHDTLWGDQGRRIYTSTMYQPYTIMNHPNAYDGGGPSTQTLHTTDVVPWDYVYIYKSPRTGLLFRV